MHKSEAAGIILINTTDVFINNLVFTNCNANGKSLLPLPLPHQASVFDFNMNPLPVTQASLIIVNSTSLDVKNIVINGHADVGLLCINIWGASHFESVHSVGLEIYYTRTLSGNGTTVLAIDQFWSLDSSTHSFKQLLQILIFKCATRIQIILSNSMFINSEFIVIGLRHVSRFTVVFDKCVFANADDHKVMVNFPPKEGLPANFVNLVQFINCEFRDSSTADTNLGKAELFNHYFHSVFTQSSFC